MVAFDVDKTGKRPDFLGPSYRIEEHTIILDQFLWREARSVRRRRVLPYWEGTHPRAKLWIFKCQLNPWSRLIVKKTGRLRW
jgi:hypothetical protein